jgi:hypothetical protein
MLESVRAFVSRHGRQSLNDLIVVRPDGAKPLDCTDLATLLDGGVVIKTNSSHVTEG